MAWTQATVNHFKTLGVRETADEDRVVKRAYREKALLHHSDRGGDNDEMVRVNAAYEVLRTKTGRARHRAELMRIRRSTEGYSFSASRWARTNSTHQHPPTDKPHDSHQSAPKARPRPPSPSARNGSLWPIAIVWGVGTGIVTGLKTFFISLVAMCFISALAFDIPTTVMIALASAFAGVAAIGGFCLRVHGVIRGGPPTG